MSEDTDDWRPGSFTKNFAWGKETGLNKLYDCIRLGFNFRLEDVSREIFRSRIAETFNFYVAANFFLFSKNVGGKDFLVVDELVFQAITAPYSRRFDMIALFAFNFSYAGEFSRSSKEQRRPALWAHWYIRDRVANQMNWDAQAVNANDIADYIFKDQRYKTSPSRKVATNLNHLYRVGRLTRFASTEVDRWWVDAFFLAMDRIIEDRLLDNEEVKENNFRSLLEKSGFYELSGRKSLEKRLAAQHLIRLYIMCGNRNRFVEDFVKGRTEAMLEAAERWLSPNDVEPVGAIHLSNLRIIKSIPAFCATLAAFAGFQVVSNLALENFDAAEYAKDHINEAFNRLKESNVVPMMTAEAVLKATRER